MFFTGLFSTHLSFFILAAVYSVSFGVYSVYCVKNRLAGKEQLKKETLLFENKSSDHNSYNLADYDGDEYDPFGEDYTESFTAQNKFHQKPPGVRKVILIPYVMGEAKPVKTYGLYCRPPPTC